tara:strand:+ start:1836 stop:2054 length:219 start_codon:yes stop_codon:yes gene_type:complete
MSDKRIICKKYDGTITILVPCDDTLTVEQIAKKDVPTGKGFKITDTSEVPEDRTFRMAWDIADSELTDGVGD